MKTLLIVSDKNLYYFNNYSSHSVYIRGIFSHPNNTAIKILKKINFPFIYLFYDSWFRKIKSFDKIIVLDIAVLTDHQLLKNIKKHSACKALFVFSWNIAKGDSSFKFEYKQAKKNGFQFYSYDMQSCSKYSLNYNSIMYDKKLKIEDKIAEYDAVFLGFLKDRKEEIIRIQKILKEANLKPRIIISGSKVEDLDFEFNLNYISYSEYLQIVSKSNAIIDIAQENQDGFSMRVMESLFLNKKLITTNQAIRNADFYNINNIYIVGDNKDNKDNEAQEIRNFFDRPYIDISNEIKDYYSIEKWAERFV